LAVCRQFSEPEAEFVHQLLLREKYSVVLDIHSGTQQIFVPFVDTESRKTHRTRPETPEELRLVDYIQSQSGGWYKDSGIAWKYNDYGADGTIMDYLGGVAKVPYALCAEIYGDPTVDNSIDCFVQFNPQSGTQYVDSMAKIRTLYTGTFDYFLAEEQQLKERMVDGVREMQQYLLGIAKGDIAVESSQRSVLSSASTALSKYKTAIKTKIETNVEEKSLTSWIDWFKSKKNKGEDHI